MLKVMVSALSTWSSQLCDMISWVVTKVVDQCSASYTLKSISFHFNAGKILWISFLSTFISNMQLNRSLHWSELLKLQPSRYHVGSQDVVHGNEWGELTTSYVWISLVWEIILKFKLQEYTDLLRVIYSRSTYPLSPHQKPIGYHNFDYVGIEFQSCQTRLEHMSLNLQHVQLYVQCMLIICLISHALNSC